MWLRRMLAILGTAIVPTVTLVAASTNDLDGASRMKNEMIARQFDYFDELDLKRHESLEAEFGASCRVLSSTNAVRFGPLEVRVKLVLPRSDAPRKTGLFASNDPERVRVMLDYALVSCRNGCEVGVLTEPGATTRQYKANHDWVGSFGKSPYAAKATTRSMAVIEGKQARLAIQQLNGSRQAHIVVITAVHGVADFEFDTSAGSDAE